ncbi:MAG: FAD:protein FMN transferase, partial [Oscillospiraceae bacterium]|nr:FAD:protein FMN transferase [Oscillospiraceae bacterium]
MKKRIGILICILVFVLGGCAPGGARAERVEMIVFAMDTVMMITAYGEGAAEAVERARAELHRLEDLFSVTYVDSDIARINAANGVPIRVSEETAEILGLALDLWRETGGAFAPGLYTLQRAWGFTTDENRV